MNTKTLGVLSGVVLLALAYDALHGLLVVIALIFVSWVVRSACISAAAQDAERRVVLPVMPQCAQAQFSSAGASRGLDPALQRAVASAAVHPRRSLERCSEDTKRPVLFDARRAVTSRPQAG
jgi:hypothetical protein